MKSKTTFSKTISVIIVQLVIVSAFSCKEDKDDDIPVLPSLSGSLTISAVDDFGNPVNFEYVDVETNRTMTFVQNGMIHPEGGGITYSWRVSPVMESSEKSEADDGSYKYTFPDSLGTYTVSCTASADGYYSTTSTKFSTVVSKTGSLTDMELDDIELETLTDERDGKEYKYVTIGGVSWFCENLRYAGDKSDDGESGTRKGTPYRNSEVMSDIFGRFYTFDELGIDDEPGTVEGSESVCPEGWRVPTQDDWKALARALQDDTIQEGGQEGDSETDDVFNGISGKLRANNAKFNGSLFWEFWPDIEKEPTSHLSMIPIGFANIFGDTKDFMGVNEYAVFWTADKVEPGDDESSYIEGEEKAYYNYLICESPNLHTKEGDTRSFAANVRCIKSEN